MVTFACCRLLLYWISAECIRPTIVVAKYTRYAVCATDGQFNCNDGLADFYCESQRRSDMWRRRCDQDSGNSHVSHDWRAARRTETDTGTINKITRRFVLTLWQMNLIAYTVSRKTRQCIRALWLRESWTNFDDLFDEQRWHTFKNKSKKSKSKVQLFYSAPES